jgi:hypothetical protein
LWMQPNFFLQLYDQDFDVTRWRGAGAALPLSTQLQCRCRHKSF